MFNRIKYSLLFLIMTTIIACKQGSQQHKTAGTEAPLNATKSFDNKSVEDSETALSTAYNLYQYLYGLNEIKTAAFRDFREAYQFTWVKEISKTQKVVVLGMGNDENRFELFLLNKKEASDWELKASEEIDTRFVIEASDIQYDSTNQLLHLVVDQTWSSHGDLSFELFYQITADTLLEVLHRNHSGGQDLEVAVYMEDSCNLDVLVNFNSNLEKVSKNELQFSVQYELLLYSNCDGTTQIIDTIMKESDRIRYTYNVKKSLYIPNWNSLKKLNKAQFEAVTDWGDLDPFEFKIEAYCQKIEQSMPKSSELLRATL